MNYQRRVAFDAWAFANYDIYSKVECWEAACEWQAAQQSACLPLTDEDIQKITGASDVYWAHSKTFILAIARAVEAALQPARLPLTDEQCDAIYLALDAWAVNVDKFELGLPWIDVGRDEVARDIIRRAVLAATTKNGDVRA